MIEIIKPGDIEKLNPKIFCECAYCGCKFTYQSQDVHSDQRDGDYIECPTCKTMLGV